MQTPAQAGNMPNSRKTSTIIMIIALVLALCIAGVSMLGAIYLFVDGLSLKKEVSALNEKIAILSKADFDTIKQDIALIKEKQDAVAEIKSAEAPDIQVGNLNFTFAGGEYTESYSGEGTITCSSKDPYLVMLKFTLLSGGSKNGYKPYVNYVAVTEGMGTFSTYDWDDAGKLIKPDYKIEVVGFVKVDSITE